jgi:uncharacterized protein with HEPN domain
MSRNPRLYSDSIIWDIVQNKIPELITQITQISKEL